MERGVLFLVVAGVVLATGSSRCRAPAPEALAGAVSAQRLRAAVEVLASDEYEGRGPGSAGSARAVAWLETRLAALPLAPMGDGGGFRQPVPMVVTRPLAGTTLELESLGEVRRPVLGRDYVLLASGDQTELPRPTPMVFVGWGITAPEFDHDDYAEVDVRGRAVVFFEGEPPSDDPRWFGGHEPTVYASTESKQRMALARGAAASIVLTVGEGAVERWRRRLREHGFPQVQPATDLPRHLSLAMAPQWSGRLFADALYDLEQVAAMARGGVMRSFHLPWTVCFDGEFEVRTVLEPNLVARLPGRDRRLADTAVVVSAHWDHLGLGPEIAGDRIYNGTVDNAMGVAAAVEILRVVGEVGGRPRRSIVLLLTAGEEAGLLGARRFLDQSPLPVSRMIANVNVDGVAFMADFRDVIAIGGDLSDLGTRVERAARSLGLRSSRPPAELWSARAFSFSDQMAFAERGVPSVLVSEGFDWPGYHHKAAVQRSLEWMREIYHSPGDDLGQEIDWQAAARHVGLLVVLVRNLADDPATPEWRPESPFAYERALSRARERVR